MKKIEAIIRQEKFEELKDALFSKTDIKGMTVNQVLGCGQQMGWKEYVRGQEVMTTLLPKVEVAIAVTDDDTEKVVDIILDYCQTEEVGDGKIFIYDIQDVIRIRTGERGEAAI